MGKKQCILVAHDWGGVVGYGVCVAYPEMVSRYVACNIPHPRSVRDEQEQSWKQRLMSWYILFFQCPIIPEFYFSHDDFTLLDGIVKDIKASNLEEVAEAYKYAFKDSQCGDEKENIGRFWFFFYFYFYFRLGKKCF